MEAYIAKLSGLRHRTSESINKSVSVLTFSVVFIFSCCLEPILEIMRTIALETVEYAVWGYCWLLAKILQVVGHICV